MDMRSCERSSIRLFSSYTALELSDMMEVGSGFRPATASDGTIAYKNGAMVPKEPWQPLNPGDISTLFNLTNEWDQHQSVAILRSNETVETLVAKEGLATRNVGSDDQASISEAFVRALADECEFAPDYVGGFVRNDPNMLTVSVNRSLGRLVGLHVDYWQSLPLSQRRFSENRISINLGPSSRYILFVPVTLEGMASLLASEHGMQVDLPELPVVFMRQYADFPVVRCRLPPGASYIVPTENMLHDGSTAAQSVESRQLIFRGHIRPQYTELAD